MATTKVQQVVLTNNDKNQHEGRLFYNYYDKTERLKRAITILLLMWFGAVCAVPIMVAHFVLVPGLLIGGIYFAHKRFHCRLEPKCVKGVCPTCGDKSNILLQSSDKLPLWTYCSTQKDPVQIVEGVNSMIVEAEKT